MSDERYPKPTPTEQRRYLNDATYHHLVDSLELLLLDHGYRVPDLHNAVLLAAYRAQQTACDRAARERT